MCWDKDVTDHVGKCSGTATDGTNCETEFQAGNTYEEDSCKDGCTWTPAPTSPTVKPSHPAVDMIDGYNGQSGACRSTSPANKADSSATPMQDRPPCKKRRLEPPSRGRSCVLPSTAGGPGYAPNGAAPLLHRHLQKEHRLPELPGWDQPCRSCGQVRRNECQAPCRPRHQPCNVLGLPQCVTSRPRCVLPSRPWISVFAPSKPRVPTLSVLHAPRRTVDVTVWLQDQ